MRSCCMVHAPFSRYRDFIDATPLLTLAAMKYLVIALSILLSGCISAPIAMTPQTAQRLQTQAPIRFC